MIEDYNVYKNIVDENLIDFLPKIDDKSNILYDSIKYSLEGEGKRLRAVLLLAASEFAGGSYKESLPYACAMEYIHAYSLIHDDLPCMDDDELRRGIPTNHKVFGAGIATLAGDGLLNSSFEIMTRDMMFHFEDDKAVKRRINAMYEIARAAGVGGMIAGQASDIDNQEKECSKEMVEYIHLNKTGALIVASIRAGLHLGGASDDMLRNLTIYAECLGIAYQIVDDILDVKGNPEIMGKAVGKDAKLSKATYVSMHGIENSYKRLRELTDKGVFALKSYYDNAEFFKTLIISLAERTK